MAIDFIIIFIILIVTFTIAFVIVKLIRPGKKDESSLKAWKTSTDEKRKHPRLDVNWPVSIVTPKGAEKGMLKNISIGGAFIACDNPLPLDESAILTIEMPRNQQLTLNGKAIWTNVNVQNDNVVNKGMRFQFTNNTADDLKLLHKAIVSASQQTASDDKASDKPGSYENRKDARIDISWPVEMETSIGVIKAETRHVSISGAFIACQNPLPLNENFRITIILSRKKQISINAEVVWSNINVPDDKVVNRGMGVKFVNNSKDDIQPLAVALMKVVTENF